MAALLKTSYNNASSITNVIYPQSKVHSSTTTTNYKFTYQLPTKLTLILTGSNVLGSIPVIVPNSQLTLTLTLRQLTDCLFYQSMKLNNKQNHANGEVVYAMYVSMYVGVWVGVG